MAEKTDIEKRVNSLEKGVNRILDILEKKPEPKGDGETHEEVSPEVKKAGANKYQTNPEWDEAAREILGEAVDHTEVEHERSGGIKFTVVIKNESSNAGPQYLELYKADRRTKDVSQEGLEGVIQWAKLIKQNLARPR